MFTPGKFPTFAMEPPSKNNNWHQPFIDLVVASYSEAFGRDLHSDFGIADSADARSVYASMTHVLLAHVAVDKPSTIHELNSPDAHKVYVYANEAALAALEGFWFFEARLPFRYDSLIGLDSGHTTCEIDRQERSELFNEIADGGGTIFSGYRRTLRGSVFSVNDGRVWQVNDERGSMVGQAASFPVSL